MTDATVWLPMAKVEAILEDYAMLPFSRIRNHRRIKKTNQARQGSSLEFENRRIREVPAVMEIVSPPARKMERPNVPFKTSFGKAEFICKARTLKLRETARPSLESIVPLGDYGLSRFWRQ